jgi:hypothetical protein
MLGIFSALSADVLQSAAAETLAKAKQASAAIPTQEIRERNWPGIFTVAFMCVPPGNR